MPLTWSYGQLWKTVSKLPILLRLPGAHILWLRFRTEPGVIRQILPRPLHVPDEPLATAFVAEFGQTNFGPSYREGVLSVDAAFKGESGNYMVGVFPTDDMATAGGRAGGYPKKMADVHLTVQEDHAVAVVSRRGAEILRLEGELLGDAGSESALGVATVGLDGEPTLNGVNWLFKSALGEGFHAYKWRPVLTRQSVLFSPNPGQRHASLDLKLVASATDPLGDIPVVEVLQAGFGLFDVVLLPARTVHRVRNPWDLYRKSVSTLDWFADMDFDDMPSLPFSERIRRWRQIRTY